MEGIQVRRDRPEIGEVVDTWVFVTGTPRSGTTFVGSVLSTPISVDYIHEPFNPACGMSDFEQTFAYAEWDSSKFDETIHRLKRYDFFLRTAMYQRDPATRRFVKRIVGSRGPFYLRIAKRNPFHRAAIVKDPIGCLLTANLVRRHGFHAIVLLRHPFAVVASYLRLGWEPREGLRALASQPQLVDKHFTDDHALLTKTWTSDFEAAAVLWRALNKVLMSDVLPLEETMFVRHEDLSARPQEVFRSLFDHGNLPWSQRVERRIARLTDPTNMSQARMDRGQDLRRDSASLAKVSGSNLTQAQRDRIWELTADVAAGWYPEPSQEVIDVR